MEIQFVDGLQSPAPRFLAQLVNKDKLPGGLEPLLSEGAKVTRFTGQTAQLHEGIVDRDGQLVRVALVGLGEASVAGRNGNIERAGAALSARYLASGETTLMVDLAGSGLSVDETAKFLLGLRLRAWRHDAYRTKLPEDQKVTLTKVTVANAPVGAKDAWLAEAALAEGVEFTRSLVTEPGNIVYPESFVERCQVAFADTGIEVIVLDEPAMRKLGMGALLGVSQGSARPPRILALHWNGGANASKPMAFVGKGVTFDSGGISLKPPAGMEEMKWDMGGAGAVAGAMLSIARRKAKANVVGICGLVENMPDGAAQRPGDVVTSMSGQTIEVINTDAEGRLVLCDVLTWVQKKFDPSAIVDLATLTGAMVMSLGAEYAGVFANDDALADKLLSAGSNSGDKLWRFPLAPAYDKLIDSPIADMKNAGPRNGGSITAAQFIQRFIDKGRAWAHCDIAGVVWSDKAGATWEKGATGYGVRLIDRYVRDNCEA
jgi:leucyl aminopeptidase